MVARPYHDELVLHVMRLLETHVHFNALPELAKKLVANLPPESLQIIKRHKKGNTTTTEEIKQAFP